MKRWILGVVAPMAAGLYVRVFCAILDIRWDDEAKAWASGLAMMTALCIILFVEERS